MKILHIITRMNTGGPAVFLDHLTSAMNDLGCESTIIYGYCQSNETDYCKDHTLVPELQKITHLHRSLNPVDDLRAFFQIKRLIKEIKPDLVNTHTSKAGVLGRIAAKSVNRNLPVVHTFHGHLIYGYFAKYKSFIFTLIERFMAAYTNAAVAVTAETKRSLIALGIGKKLNWQVIQIGIPIQDIPTIPLSLGSDLKILWVGRFTDIKDPFYAIEVARLLSNHSEINIELTMVGEGELFQNAKQFAKDLPVKFTGWLINPFTKVGNFDLLLLSSKNEGLPLVMLEAANYQRATISRDVGGVSEFIKNNQTGYLTTGAPNQMADQILKLSKNKSDLNKVGVGAKNLLVNGFSVKKMANNYFLLYSNLIIGK